MLQGGRYRALHSQHSCESKRLIQQQKWRGPSNTRLARALIWNIDVDRCIRLGNGDGEVLKRAAGGGEGLANNPATVRKGSWCCMKRSRQQTNILCCGQIAVTTPETSIDKHAQKMIRRWIGTMLALVNNDQLNQFKDAGSELLANQEHLHRISEGKREKYQGI